MVEIVVNEEQATLLRGTSDPAVVRGPDGEVLGIVARGSYIVSPEDEEAFVLQSQAIAARSPRTGSTTQEVLDRLHRLEAAE
jgi:hypothetical protein